MLIEDLLPLGGIHSGLAIDDQLNPVSGHSTRLNTLKDLQSFIQ